MADEKQNRYLGRGIYSVTDAGRLAKVSPESVRRWLFGYSTKNDGSVVPHPPVVVHDFDPIEGTPAVSFLDLIQIRFVAAFREHGVSLHEIRLAASRAAEILGSEHPFATRRFYTDRKRVLAQITADGRDPELVALTQRQYELHDALIPYLHKGIEFEDFELAQRWWPMGRDHRVVVDPHRNFGRPTIASSRIPTEILSIALERMGSVSRVATWYEVTEEEVSEAVKFERLYAA